jgi:hypothetical protein
VDDLSLWTWCALTIVRGAIAAHHIFLLDAVPRSGLYLQRELSAANVIPHAARMAAKRK